MKLQKILILFLLVLFMATVVTAVKASSAGGQLITLENKASEIAEENKELRAQIVVSSSLREVEKKAQTLGMQKPDKFVYITRDGLAMR